MPQQDFISPQRTQRAQRNDQVQCEVTMLCKSCHYPLKQLAEPRCPECGRAFDPHDPTTFETTVIGAGSRLLRFVGYTIFAMVVFAMFWFIVLLWVWRIFPGAPRF
jgi:hypothetical protein